MCVDAMGMQRTIAQNTIITPTVGVDCTHHQPPGHPQCAGDCSGEKQNICFPTSPSPA